METEHTAVISEAVLSYNNKATTKSALFRELSGPLGNYLHIPSPTIVLALEDREQLSTTGFGDGLAIPHGIIPGINQPHVIFIRLNQEVEWAALDGKPVKECFFLLIPASDATNIHLQLLSKLAYYLADEEYQKKIHETNDELEMKELIDEMMQRTSDEVMDDEV